MELQEKKKAARGVVLIVLGMGLILLSIRSVSAPRDEGVADAILPDDDAVEICAQVITSAKNNETGEVRDFATPCDVPEGWTAL